MKSLTQLRIEDADPRLASISREERNAKIDLLYSLGYVYDPYAEIFFNPFIDQGLKAMVIYDWDQQTIEKFHDAFVEKFKTKNQIITVEEISRKIYGNNKVSRLGSFLEVAAGMIGISFLAIAIIVHLLIDSVSLTLAAATVSFIFLIFYVAQNLLFGMNEGRALRSRFWYKYQNGLIGLSIAVYPYLYYLLYRYTNNYWVPIIILLAIRYSIRKHVKRILSKQFWQMTGMFCVKEYAEQHETSKSKHNASPLASNVFIRQ